MPNVCSVLGCSTNRRPKRDTSSLVGVSFHRFPTDSNLRNEWVERIGRVDWHPARRSLLCSRHFTDDCFIRPVLPGFYCRKALVPGAVPTLFTTSTVDRFQRKRHADINWVEEVCKILLIK